MENVDSLRLILLLEIERTGSISAAAQACAIDQPSASMHLRTLEAALGRKLVTRTGRVTSLTAAGKIVASRATKQRRVSVLGYASVGAQRVENPNVEFQRQGEKIAAACLRRGLLLVGLVQEREPLRGRALERPALGYLLEQILSGEVKGLVVAELSRLTHSVPELGRVLEWFSQSDARLIAAAQDLDTEEESGRLAVRTIIEISRWERDRLAERTRNGMRAAHRMGPPGVADYPELAERIARTRAAGMTLQAIADRLNAEGVPTVRGGAKWRPSSVQAAAGYRRPIADRRSGPPDRRMGDSNPPAAV